jgi:hypothetical protein
MPLPRKIGTGRALLRPRAFSPLSINGLQAWYRADNLPLNDGDAVSTWMDQSGYSNHATQSGGNRPTYKTGIQNGKPMVLFAPASSQYMRANGVAAAFTGADMPMSLFIALKPDALGAQRTAASFASTVTTTPFFRLIQSAANAWTMGRRDDASAAKAASGGTVDTNAHLIGVVFTGTTVTVYDNGAVIGAAGADLDVGTLTVDSFAIGTLARAAPTEFFSGYQGEIIVYNSALSTTDRQRVETYLNARWALF